MAGAPPPSSPSLKLRSLPVIDISPWIHPEEEHYRGHNGGRRSTAAALHAACLTYGFFYLDISSYASQEEMDELANLGRQFFSLPQEVKDAISITNQDHARGYQRLKENVTNGKADNHEGLDLYASVASPDKSKPLHGENQWPSDADVPGFRAKFERWVEKMKALGMIVMEAMSVGLGMTPEEWNDLKGKVDDSFWVMRIIGYPPLPNDYDGFSCGAHRDYGCLTFLYADPTPNALQVFLSEKDMDDAANTPIRSSSGQGLAPSAASAMMEDVISTTAATDVEMSDLPDEEGTERGVWITADPKPGCVVCNIGEMWEVWTNGLYKSTLHRVVHRGSNYRVSIPFFFEPNFNARVEPLAAALRLQKDSIQPAFAYTPQHPPMNQRHYHYLAGQGNGEPGELLAKRLKEIVNDQASRSQEASPVPIVLDVPSITQSAVADDSESISDKATAGWTSARSSVSYASDEPRMPYSPVSNQDNGLHAHSNVYTPLSVERKYNSVVYGEFLMKKVTNNFDTGKGRY